MKTDILYTLEQLPQVVKNLIELIKPLPGFAKSSMVNLGCPEPLALSKEPLVVSLSNHAVIITLTGDLGAGKTTLVKQLLKSWGVQDEILSPTFTYVNCYKNDQGQKIYHFDLYRVLNSNQFFELGFDEYLHEPGAVCLVEWPGVIAPILTNLPVLRLEIEHVSDISRKLMIKS